MKALLSYVLYMIPGFIFTGLIVFIHELGHYGAAKLLGAQVEVLGFGFGPVIWSRKGRNTEFRISLIPFGGYCRIGGSEDLSVALENGSSQIAFSEKGSFFGISSWRKLLIFLAGPLTNLIIAFILMITVSAFPVERVSHKCVVAPLSSYPTLYESYPEQSGIESGDIILSSGDRVFLDWEDFTSWLKKEERGDVPLLVLRDGRETETVIKAFDIDGSTSYCIMNLEEPVIGRSESDEFSVGDRIIEANGVPIEWTTDINALNASSFTFTVVGEKGEREVKVDGKSFPFAWKAELRVSPDSDTPVSTGIEKTITLLKKTALAIAKLVSFRFSEALEVISGPFTSASTIGRISTLAFSTSTQSGFRTLLYLFSIVSISIAVGNMIPIPTFDGGQMLIAFAEIIRGKILKPKTYLFLHIFGMVAAWVIIILMNAWGIVEKLFL